MDKILFETEIKKIFPDVSKDFFMKIEIYKYFLQQYNQTTNLTRLDSEDKIYKDYFYESVVSFRQLDFSSVNSLLDIGSGSGIPGIVLKLMFPHISLQIIEANQKKTNFLKGLIAKLEVNDVFINNKRAEDLDSFEYEQFDIVTSRAVAALPHILELSIPYAKVNGMIIEPKSTNLKEEMKDIDNLLYKMSSKLEKIDSFTSINNVLHQVVYIKKTKITDRFFPRKWSKILNEPI